MFIDRNHGTLVIGRIFTFRLILIYILCLFVIVYVPVCVCIHQHSSSEKKTRESINLVNFVFIKQPFTNKKKETKFNPAPSSSILFRCVYLVQSWFILSNIISLLRCVQHLNTVYIFFFSSSCSNRTTRRQRRISLSFLLYIFEFYYYYFIA